MYRLFTLAVLMLFSGTIAGATTIISTDGAWWSSLNEHDRAIAMFAATNAYNIGYSVGTVKQFKTDLLREVARDRRFRTPKQEAQELKWQLKYEQSHEIGAEPPDFSGKEMGSFIDGMTYFYSSHPDKGDLNFAHVLRCIANKPDETCDRVAKEGF